MSSNKQKGFTLVELSIVIVIVGLIVSGVVAGQSLVKQAQLRSIISEQEQLKSTINAFRLEYNGYPGDITNGSSYFTTGCSAAGGWAAASVAADCNGDGNSQVLMAAGNTGEAYAAWVELAKANLYPGVFIPGAVVAGTINTNIPASKFSGYGITLGYDDSSSDLTAGDAASSGGRDAGKNVIVFGSATAGVANGTGLSVNRAYVIDTKVDDGNPVKGIVLAVGVVAAGATDCGVAATSLYKYNSTDTAPCSVAFPF